MAVGRRGRRAPERASELTAGVAPGGPSDPPAQVVGQDPHDELVDRDPVSPGGLVQPGPQRRAQPDGGRHPVLVVDAADDPRDRTLTTGCDGPGDTTRETPRDYAPVRSRETTGMIRSVFSWYSPNPG